MDYLSQPTEVMKAYLESIGLDPDGTPAFEAGRVSMALEILTVVRSLEMEIVPMLSLQRAEIISILTTLLQEQGLDEDAERWYSELNQWRKPSFSLAPSLGHNAQTEVHSSVRAFPVVDLRESLAQYGSIDVPPGSDQSPAPPSDELEPRTGAEDDATPNE